VETFVLGLIGLAVAASAFVVAFLLPIATWVRVSRALREAQRANARVEALERLVDALSRDRRRERETAARSERPPDPAPTARAAEPAPSAEGEAAPPLVPPAAAASVAAAAATPPALPHLWTPPVPPVAEPEATTAAPPTSPAVVPVTPAVATPRPHHAAPPVASAESPRAHHATPAASGASLEVRIGQRWLLYAGIAAIVLGASYVVKLAFENNWITPAMRVLLSAAGGAVLVGLGQRFAARGLAFFGHALSGAGFAVIYVAIYAALNLYDLIDRTWAFGAMTAVTAAGAVLANRRSALPLALVALVGGFATPLLVGGDRGAYVALFTYYSLLIAGAVFLARRHAWPLLTLTAFGLTVLSFALWASFSYRESAYLVVQGYLTLWLAAFAAAVAWPDEDRVEEPDAAGTGPAMGAGVAFIVGALAPLLYHLASLANLARHSRDLLIYFIAATLAGVLYSADGKRPWARLAIWIAVWVPLVGWLLSRGRPAGALVTVLAIFGLHLLSEMRVFLREPERLDAADALLLHLNGLGLLAGLLALIPRWDTDRMAAAAAVVAGSYLVLALLVRSRHRSVPLHYVALASACAAGAISLRFEGAWITVGWAVEGALLVWLGLRERRQWLRLGGALLIGLGSWHGLEHMASAQAHAMTPWLNAPALSLVAIALLLLWTARRYATLGQDLPGAAELPIGACTILAAVIGLVVITEQINTSYGLYAWRRQDEAGPMAAGAADLSRQVTLSIVWAAYAVGLLAAGILRSYAVIRYLAIVILTATIAKVFFVDLARLDRVYRIASVIGLGVLLLLASYLYQRFVTDDDRPSPPPGDTPPQGE
jgi:uncharacterized membrane protein